MTTTRWLWVAALAACGGSSSKTPMPDAPSAPAMITISGTATSRSLSGTTPVSGAMVGAFKSDDTMVAMTTTDASGNYSLTVPTGGVALDGYVKASMSGYLDTYLYAPAPLTADFSMASINMLTPDNFNLLSTTLCDANQMTSMGTIGVEVMDASMNTVAGATVTSTPAATKYCYDMGGFPNKTATVTDTDGVVVLFNVTGSISLSASLSGATFKTHSVKAVAGAFTTTIISE